MNSRQRSVLIRVTIAVVVFLYVAYVANQYVLSGRLPRFDFVVITAFVGVYFIFTIITETLLYKDPDVFVTEDDDRWTYALLQLSSITGLFYAAIDFLSTHWTRLYSLEPGIIYLGFVLFAISGIYRGWGLLAIGKYFNPRISIYEDHQLVTSGPYRKIRHPLYLGVLISLIATDMVFSSWGALLITVFFTLPILIYRIKLEEEFLLKHFGDDYKEYMQHSKKLIPGLW
ncbi:MAG: isoprenylcysteine carboxylmethyltransferase family protein [Syntrophomonadaceae bacterium]|jgi:protein-S-isoprenylcysteine O-methyltransferase Ste14|nr:isoprenylcysteine carboxylmethyltransferase family protein [Syntrophomonadaceae bacterium]